LPDASHDNWFGAMHDMQWRQVLNWLHAD
jgi:hypothetical protein